MNKLTRFGLLTLLTLLFLSPPAVSHAGLLSGAKQWWKKNVLRQSFEEGPVKPKGFGEARARDIERASGLARVTDDSLSRSTEGMFHDFEVRHSGLKEMPLIGRESEMADLVARLVNDTNDVVILQGPEKVGMTHLLVGLLQKIKRGEVPPELIGAKIITVNVDANEFTKAETFNAMVGKLKEMTDEAFGEETPLILQFPNLGPFLGDEKHAAKVEHFLTSIYREMGQDRVRVVMEGTEQAASKVVSGSSSTMRGASRMTVEALDSSVVRDIVDRYADLSVQAMKANGRDVKLGTDKFMTRLDEFATIFYAGVGEPYAQMRLIDGAISQRKSLLASTERSISKGARLQLNRLQKSLDKAKGMSGRKAKKVRDEYPAKIEAQKKIIERADEAIIKIQDDKKVVDDLLATLDKDGELSEADHRLLYEAKERLETVTIDDLALFVHYDRGVALEDLVDAIDAKGVEELLEIFGRQIKGQDQAVRLIVEAIRAAKSALRMPGEPISSMLFIGPTGVGKTEVAKVASKLMAKRLLRQDMGEVTQQHATSILTGAPPGYVGYNSGQSLAERAYADPNSIMLLDELEKAREERVYNLLLPVLDDGILTASNGRVANLENMIIIGTTNVLTELPPGVHPDDVPAITKLLREGFEKLGVKLGPEWFSRWKHFVVFNKLRVQDLAGIVDIQIAQINKILERLNMAEIYMPKDEVYKFARWAYDNTPNQSGREMKDKFTQIVRQRLSNLVSDLQYTVRVPGPDGHSMNKVIDLLDDVNPQQLNGRSIDGQMIEVRMFSDDANDGLTFRIMDENEEIKPVEVPEGYLEPEIADEVSESAVKSADEITADEMKDLEEGLVNAIRESTGADPRQGGAQQLDPEEALRQFMGMDGN